MTAKEYLSQYEEKCYKVVDIDDKIKQVRYHAMSPSCKPPDGMPRTTNMNDLSAFMAELERLKKEKERAEYERNFSKLLVKTAIATLNDENQKTVLRARYLNFMTWRQISKIIGKTTRQTQRIHEQAVTQIIVE